MFHRQETRSEISFLIIRQTFGVRENDERGKIVSEAAEAIRNPCSHAGETRKEKAGVHHVTSRPVDVGL